MTRDYATPLAFKQALEARLRGESQRRGTALHRVRQLVVFDRMLARMIAVLGDALILKGGVALELRSERARATKDIDVRAAGDPDAFLERLQEGGRLDLGDFMTFEVTPDRRHAELEVEGLKYGGRRYRAEARLAGKMYGAAFGIDVAFAEPVAGEIETLVGSDLLGFARSEPERPAVRSDLEAHGGVREPPPGRASARALPRPRPAPPAPGPPEVERPAACHRPGRAAPGLRPRGRGRSRRCPRAWRAALGGRHHVLRPRAGPNRAVGRLGLGAGRWSRVRHRSTSSSRLPSGSSAMTRSAAALRVGSTMSP